MKIFGWYNFVELGKSISAEILRKLIQTMLHGMAKFNPSTIQSKITEALRLYITAVSILLEILGYIHTYTKHCGVIIEVLIINFHYSC